jgi:dTDP-glucose 4,6-dehydratase
MSSNSRKILVTGGCGFIGANFILYWLKKYPDDVIINLDALTYAGNQTNLRALENDRRYSFVHGNINNAELVNKIMNDVDTVVHFAAESHVDRSILNPSIFLQTNVLGTQVLLDSALRHKIKRFHHISTDEVFGSLELGSTQKFNETTPYSPRSPYSASKAASDHLVRAYGETYGLPFTITNCSNNYGAFQFPEKLIALAITNLIDNLPVPIYGDGANVRDWLFVTDHCSAIDAVLSKGEDFSTYLVGGLNDDFSNLEVIKMILKLMSKPEDQVAYVQDRPGHDRRYSVDWSPINSKLGWKPEVSLEEGLAQTIEWYKNNQDWWRPLKNYTPAK